jgi:hypothetical protein
MRVKLTSGARSDHHPAVMAAPNPSVMATPNPSVMTTPNPSVMAALVAAIHPQSVGQWRPDADGRHKASPRAALRPDPGGGYHGQMCDRTAHPCGN